MTIRELIIKFGFEVDRQSQQRVENSVNGIKNLAKRLLQGIQIVFSSFGVERLQEQLSQTAEAAQGIQNDFSDAAENIEDAAGQAGDSLGDMAEAARQAADAMTDSASQAAGNLGDSIQETAEQTRNSVEEITGSLSGEILQSLQEIADGTGQTLDEVQAGIVQMAEEYQNQGLGASEAVARSIQDVTESISQAENQILSSARQTIQEIANQTGTSSARIRSEVARTATEYRNQGINAGEAVRRALEEVADSARQAAKESEQSTTRSLKEIANATGRTVRQIRREIAEVSADYQQMGMEASEAFQNAYQDLSDAAGAAGQEAENNIQEASDAAENASGRIIGGFKKMIGVFAAAFAVDKIREFGQGCIEAAATTNATASQFEQVFVELEGNAEKSLQKISEDTGIVENRMKASYTKIAAFAKTTGMETADALALTNRSMEAIADSAAFYDRSLEDVTETMQSFLKGNYENDSALGLSCTETTRNTAANKLYGKSFKDLSESQKQLTLLQMVEDANATSGALGQAARESDTLENQMGNLKQAFFDLKSAVGQYLLEPFITGLKLSGSWLQMITDKVQSATDKMPDMADTAKRAADMVNIAIRKAYGQLERVHALVKRLQPAAERFLQAAWNGTKRAVSVVKEVVERLGGIGNVLKILSVAAGALFLVMKWGKITSEARKFVTMLKTIGKLFSAANLKILGVVALIVLLALIVEDFVNFLMGNDSLIGEMFDKAGIGADNARAAILAAWDYIKTAAEHAKDKLLEVWKSISDALLAIGKVLYSVGSSIFHALAAVIEAVFKAVKAFWNSWGSDVLDWFQVLWDSLGGTLSGFLDVIKGIADFISSVFTGDWQGAWEAIKEIFMGVWKVIVSYFTAVLETLKLLLTVALSVISAVWQTIWKGISSFFVAIWNKIVSFLSNVLSKIKTFFSNTFDNIKSSVIDRVKGIKDAIVNGITEAIDWIKQLPKEAIGWGADMINGMVDGIKGAVGKVKDAASGVAEKITSFLHFSVPDEGPLKDYESWMPDFMSGLAKGIWDNKDMVLDKIHSIADGMSILMQAATAQPATIATSTVNNTKQSSVMQTNHFSNTYIGNDREAAKNISKGMKKSAGDATTELARALEFSRG